MTNSVGRLGDFITQGVSTVAGPFNSLGGAVDIIVVEQEDGSFRSTPWYVKFGKVFGVIKRTEKKVEVAVNGVEANFHMYLASSGRAYFLTESGPPQGENTGKSIVITKDGVDVTNKFEGNSTDTSSKVSNLNDGFVISSERKLAKKQLRQLKAVIGLIFRGRRHKFLDQRHVSSPRKNQQKVSDKIALIEMAEMTADLLDRKWCTGYPKGMWPNQQKIDDANLAGYKDDPEIQYRETHAELMERKWFTGYPKGLKAKRQISHDAQLSDNRDDPQIQNMETQPKMSEVVFVSVDDDVVKGSVSSLGRGKRKSNEYSSLDMDQPHKSRIRETKNTHLSSTENRSNLDQFSSFSSKLAEVQIPSVCVPCRRQSTITRHYSVAMSDVGHQTLNAESTDKSTPCYKVLLLEEMGATSDAEAVDCADVSVKELNSSGTEGADAAENLEANDHNRQPGRHKRMNAPTSEQLCSLNLKKGQNLITFTFYSSVFGKQQVDARIYLWKWNSRIVVSDVDGTITKSDVLGHFMPLVGKDWSQLGVARLFSAIKDNGFQFLFLSARAISQAYVTRQFLLNLKQAGETLPDGPIVISPDGLFPSLYREVILRTPHEFKIGCLKNIKALFPANCNPFYAGFGNRDTDEISYLQAGIPKGKIFTINPKGEIVVNRVVDSKSYTSLHKLVNEMFPSMPSSEHEDFNSWNYWKMPLPRIEDKM